MNHQSSHPLCMEYFCLAIVSHWHQSIAFSRVSASHHSGCLQDQLNMCVWEWNSFVILFFIIFDGIFLKLYLLLKNLFCFFLFFEPTNFLLKLNIFKYKLENPSWKIPKIPFFIFADITNWWFVWFIRNKKIKIVGKAFAGCIFFFFTRFLWLNDNETIDFVLSSGIFTLKKWDLFFWKKSKI